MNLNHIKAVMLGHAVGDALGVPVEFMSRKELSDEPVTGMRGFGAYPVPIGAWSDDTSMSLCALESLSRGKFDPDDVMDNFGRWYYDDEFTPTGEMFDVGNTCSNAINAYCTLKKKAECCGQTGESSNGNGSLMRIHPFTVYLESKEMPLAEKIAVIHCASALTHVHERSKIGCGIFSFVMWELLRNPSKGSIANGLSNAKEFYSDSVELSAYRRIFDESFAKLSADEIRSSGYVVDTLEAALWCLLTTDSYRDCVLKAVNLGDDTDTVAAIAGGLAGALYGLTGIPDEWLLKLLRREFIEDMCERAFSAWSTDDKK